MEHEQSGKKNLFLTYPVSRLKRIKFVTKMEEPEVVLGAFVRSARRYFDVKIKLPGNLNKNKIHFRNFTSLL